MIIQLVLGLVEGLLIILLSAALIASVRKCSRLELEIEEKKLAILYLDKAYHLSRSNLICMTKKAEEAGADVAAVKNILDGQESGNTNSGIH